MLALEEAEPRGRMPRETLPVILTRKAQQLEIGSVPLSRFGNPESCGRSLCWNENGAVACAVTARSFSLWPRSWPQTSLK